MGESEPSVTLPRTSPPAIVRYQQGPILQSYPAIDATVTSASRAWVHVGQPAPKTTLKRAARSFTARFGRHGSPRFVVPCHDFAYARAALSRCPLTPPACAARSRSPLAPLARAALSRRPLARGRRERLAPAEVTPPRESLANWLRSSVGRYRHVGPTGGVCGLGRPSAAPSQVDGRSWERHFQRRGAKCITLGISKVASTSLLVGISTSLLAFQSLWYVTVCASPGCGLPVICS